MARTPVRRFPSPWTVEELDACFIVNDGDGQKLAYVYFEDEPGHLMQIRQSEIGPRSNRIQSGAYN
jgi:hypothetical protein